MSARRLFARIPLTANELGLVLAILGAVVTITALDSQHNYLKNPGDSLKEIVRAETERVERGLILSALEETGGNVTHAAKKLKISRKSLQTKMKELNLRDADYTKKE